MSEDYRIISSARGEPRALGETGVCVRVQLSGCPSRRWSRDLVARLTRELVGHPSSAHLRVNVDDLVQRDEIVLDGVEDRDAVGLAAALRRAVDAANHASVEEPDRVPNVTQAEADSVANHMPVGESGQAAITDAEDDPLCPRCGQAVSVTAGDREAGDQLVLSKMDCPNCGAQLVRDIEGHADRGWRLAN
jgi:ribosomal protein S27AE